MIDWKNFLLVSYKEGVSKALKEVIEKSENKYDDMVFPVLDNFLVGLLEEKEEK